MKYQKKKLCYLSCFIVLATLFFSGLCQAFNPSDYPLSTISTEFTKAEDMYTKGVKPVDPKAIVIAFFPRVSFAIQAEYSGQTRELSEKHRQCLEAFQKTYNLDNNRLYETYQHEILFRDSDGKEYWLPIQETFRDPLRDETYTDCKLTLYLLMVLIYDHEPFLLINEFQVQ
jgi:hypothetical protein